MLAIYKEKMEIAVGNSNGTCHSVWEAWENMGYDFRECNFSTL